MAPNGSQKALESSHLLPASLSASDLQKSIDALVRTYVSSGKIQGICIGDRLDLQEKQLLLLLTFTRRLASQLLTESEDDEAVRQITTLDSAHEDDCDDEDDNKDSESEF